MTPANKGKYGRCAEQRTTKPSASAGIQPNHGPQYRLTPSGARWMPSSRYLGGSELDRASAQKLQMPNRSYTFQFAPATCPDGQTDHKCRKSNPAFGATLRFDHCRRHNRGQLSSSAALPEELLTLMRFVADDSLHIQDRDSHNDCYRYGDAIDHW